MKELILSLVQYALQTSLFLIVLIIFVKIFRDNREKVTQVTAVPSGYNPSITGVCNNMTLVILTDRGRLFYIDNATRKWFLIHLPEELNPKKGPLFQEVKGEPIL